MQDHLNPCSYCKYKRLDKVHSQQATVQIRLKYKSAREVANAISYESIWSEDSKNVHHMGVGRLCRACGELEVENLGDPKIMDFRPKNATIETRSSMGGVFLCHTWYL